MKQKTNQDKKTRKCGPCRECCIGLAIDDIDLKKEAGVECEHLSVQHGCSIYEERPKTCRGFSCGWLIVPFLPHSTRPDKCGFIVNINKDSASNFTLIPNKNYIQSLTSTDALEVIATCIQYDFKISISVPGKLGHQRAKTLLTGIITKGDLTSEHTLRMKILAAISFSLEQPTDLILQSS